MAKDRLLNEGSGIGAFEEQSSPAQPPPVGIPKVDFVREGRWSVKVNGLVNSNHNEQKDAWQEAVNRFYEDTSATVEVLPPTKYRVELL